MKRIDNKGLTLVELMVSIAIFSLIMVAVFNVLIVSTKTYTKNSQEVDAQNEAQALLNQLDNMLSDAIDVQKSTASLYFIGKKVTEYVTTTDATGNIVTTENTHDEIYALQLDGKNLYFSTKAVYEAGNTINDANLLSQDLTSFTLSVENLENYAYVTANFTVDKDGSRFKANKNIFIRNVKPDRGEDDSEAPETSSSTAEETSSTEESSSEEGGTPTGGGGTPTGGGGTPTGGEVTTPTITGIYATTKSGVTYTEGGSVDVNVFYKYSDGTESDCSSYTANPSQLVKGSNTYTITYGSHSCTVTIDAQEKIEKPNRLEASISKTYYAGIESPQKDEITVKYVYNDNSVKIVPSGDFEILAIVNGNCAKISEKKYGLKCDAWFGVNGINGIPQVIYNGGQFVEGDEITTEYLRGKTSVVAAYNDGSKKELPWEFVGTVPTGKLTPGTYNVNIKAYTYNLSFSFVVRGAGSTVETIDISSVTNNVGVPIDSSKTIELRFSADTWGFNWGKNNSHYYEIKNARTITVPASTLLDNGMLIISCSVLESITVY